MSEVGGHTDDDDEDDIETARAEIDEMADFVDFREGTALDNDERRNEARRDAHAKRAIQEDEEDTKKMKEIVENGNLKTIYMEERVRGAVIDLLESFIGVVQGRHVSTVHQGYTYSIVYLIP